MLNPYEHRHAETASLAECVGAFLLGAALFISGLVNALRQAHRNEAR